MSYSIIVKEGDLVFELQCRYCVTNIRRAWEFHFISIAESPVPLRINRFEMDTVKHKYPQYYAMVYMPIAEHLNSIVSIRIPMIQACSCQSQDDTFSIPLHPSNHL